MMNAILQYDPSDTPKGIEIVKYQVQTDDPADPLIEKISAKGEVLMIIECQDSIVIIIREGYFGSVAEGARCNGES